MFWYSVFYEEYENEKKKGQKIWPSPTGIWTPDFWPNSRPKFEFWGRLVLSSSWFLDFLDFNGYKIFWNSSYGTSNPHSPINHPHKPHKHHSHKPHHHEPKPQYHEPNYQSIPQYHEPGYHSESQHHTHHNTVNFFVLHFLFSFKR